MSGLPGSPARGGHPQASRRPQGHVCWGRGTKLSEKKLQWKCANKDVWGGSLKERQTSEQNHFAFPRSPSPWNVNGRRAVRQHTGTTGALKNGCSPCGVLKVERTAAPASVTHSSQPPPAPSFCGRKTNSDLRRFRIHLSLLLNIPKCNPQCWATPGNHPTQGT